MPLGQHFHVAVVSDKHGVVYLGCHTDHRIGRRFSKSAIVEVDYLVSGGLERRAYRDRNPLIK